MPVAGRLSSHAGCALADAGSKGHACLLGGSGWLAACREFASSILGPFRAPGFLHFCSSRRPGLLSVAWTFVLVPRHDLPLCPEAAADRKVLKLY